MGMKNALRPILLPIILLCALLFPIHVFAHASLDEVSPAPDSRLDSPPGQISLTFNERLEKSLYYIKVLYSDGQSAVSKKAVMSEDQRTLTLELPEKLPDDYYTVSYKVISADGHPVEMSYIFTVGDANSPAAVTQADEPQTMDGMQMTNGNGHDESLDIGQMILFLSRMAYFLTMLCLVGWLFWGILAPMNSDALRQLHKFWFTVLQRAFLLALICMIALQLPDMIDEWTGASFVDLLGTSIGLSWISSLLLSVIGFYVLRRSQMVDALWIALLLAAKSISGHAMAYDPPLRTIALDWVHLLAAAIWAGGLLFVVVHWRKHRDYTLQFLPTFSRASWMSLLALIATGVASTLIFLPKLSYIVYTRWGILLLVKVGLVLLVLVAGSLMRRRIKKQTAVKSGWLIKLDFSLMIMIVIIVGIFTYSNPVPANTPLYWHVMGQSVHMSAVITPNAPGINAFEVDVWLPEEQKLPKNVQMHLKYRDDEEVAPIEVPLKQSFDHELPYSSPGLTRFVYVGEGPYLPFAGHWELEVRVMDALDNEKVYNKSMMIY